MMRNLIVGLLRFSVRSAIQLAEVMVARALVPRLPPHNYVAEAQSPSLPFTLKDLNSKVDTNKSKNGLLSANEVVVRHEDQMALVEPLEPEGYLKPSITVFDYDLLHTTPSQLKAAESVDDDFSICTPLCSPSKAMYITPIRSLYKKIPDDGDIAVLRAASERINALLKQSRQRVDAGEDPSHERNEARRRRTEELGLLPSAF